MDFHVGQVLVWKRYPFQRDGILKTRYFVYLGDSGNCTCLVECYFISCTTRLQYYQDGGERSGHIILRVDAGTYRLPMDSIFDFDLSFDSHHKESLQGYEADLSVLYQLDAVEIRKFYEHICRSPKISLRAKQDVYRSMEKSGITGICPPQRKKPRKYSLR